MKRFHESIRSVGKLTKRETVIALLIAAGYEDDRKTWTRLYVENAVLLPVAQQAWATGRRRKASELSAGAVRVACELCGGEPTRREGVNCFGCNGPSEMGG